MVALCWYALLCFGVCLVCLCVAVRDLCLCVIARACWCVLLRCVCGVFGLAGVYVWCVYHVVRFVVLLSCVVFACCGARVCLFVVCCWGVLLLCVGVLLWCLC